MEKATDDHDRKFVLLLERCRERGIKLNPKKLNMHRRSVPYMGHLFTDQGLKANPLKVEAICIMPPPSNKEGVQRLLGTVNYLAKLVSNMSEITAPLRSLMRSDVEWSWDPTAHGESFEAIKRTLQNAPVLRYFDNRKPVVVQCDASQSGLGCTILQDGFPSAYGSR